METDTSLAGRELAFTGRLVSMTRADAIERLERAGARCVRAPGESTDLLVVGQARGPLREDGGLTANLARFRELKERGLGIRLVEETDLLRLLGDEQDLEDLTRLYTTAQVSRIVDTRVSEVRAWLRHGLIQPARVAKRLAWFEFKDVVFARSLSRLTASGIPALRIRRSLGEISRWLPDAGRMIGRIEAWDRELRVRLGDGAWAEPSGQILLDFASDAAARAASAAYGGVADFPGVGGGAALAPDAAPWFSAGVAAEERGDLEGAAEAYRRAAGSTPEPETCFNLGNVLYDLGHEVEAAERYLQAIEADRDFAEAWNNLGNAMASMGKLADAVHAYETALALEPAYADAHCNLAAVLERLGRPAQALEHRAACEKASPSRRHLELLRAADESDE